MSSESNLPQPRPRVAGQPRVFAIVFLGRGTYGLDVIEPPNGPRRLRRSTSLSAMRRHLAKLQAPGDLVLMSEVLRALEVMSAPMSRIKRLESVLGPEVFGGMGIVECVPDLAIEGGKATPPESAPSPGQPQEPPAAKRSPWPTIARATWSIEVQCSMPLPRHRISGLFNDGADSEGDGGDDARGPGIN